MVGAEIAGGCFYDDVGYSSSWSFLYYSFFLGDKSANDYASTQDRAEGCVRLLLTKTTRLSLQSLYVPKFQEPSWMLVRPQQAWHLQEVRGTISSVDTGMILIRATNQSHLQWPEIIMGVQTPRAYPGSGQSCDQSSLQPLLKDGLYRPKHAGVGYKSNQIQLNICILWRVYFMELLLIWTPQPHKY